MLNVPVTSEQIEADPLTKRLRELLVGSEGEYRTLVQIAMRGATLLLNDKSVQQSFSVELIESTLSFIQEILLITRELNGDNTPALIADTKLNELISQNPEVSNFLDFGIGGRIPENVAQHIYLYFRYLGYSSNNPAHLSFFRRQLNEVISSTHISDYELGNCLQVLLEMINSFHKLNNNT